MHFGSKYSINENINLNHKILTLFKILHINDLR